MNSHQPYYEHSPFLWCLEFKAGGALSLAPLNHPFDELLVELEITLWTKGRLFNGWSLR